MRLRPVFTVWFTNLFLALLCSGAAETAAVNRNALYVFGDSLSDTGSVASPSSYYQGRWSNGAVWVEYFTAAAWGELHNFAQAGSDTSNLAPEISRVPASANLAAGTCLLWCGGNDINNHATGSAADLAAATKAGVANLKAAITSLTQRGARDFVVLNLPDLGQAPVIKAGLPPDRAALVTAAVRDFNTGLAQALAEVRSSVAGIQITQVDVFAQDSAVLANPAAFGFTKIYPGALNDPTLADKSFSGLGSTYVFWDQIHPTTKLHA